MADLSESLKDVAQRIDKVLSGIDNPAVAASISRLEDAVVEANDAFSGSWLGYHSRVYYRGLNTPPAGAHFSREDGLDPNAYGSETRGDWHEYQHDEVYEPLKDRAGDPSLEEMIELVNGTSTKLLSLREEVISLLTAICEGTEDKYVTGVLEGIKDDKLISANEFVKAFQPKGEFRCSDDRAISSGGFLTPPHIWLRAQVSAIKHRITFGKDHANAARNVAAHLERRRSAKSLSIKQGSKVFLGHGRSPLWKDLKDFVKDRLKLDWDEFNRVPVAGFTNIARLSEMLGEAGIAFLIMTAEDELKDGKVHARMNVIHEAGLFQGRLGFSRAIIVLEEGCEEFSNVQGLGQIRFPAGNIKAAFEDIRLVLEREGFLESS
jgi:predicted nucleotide-binding protein